MLKYVINLTDKNNQPVLGEDLFKKLEKSSGDLNFFDDYCTYIVDNPNSK